VDDTVYSFGGINMDNESFENTDFIFKFKDAKLAASILAEHLQVRRADRGGGAFRSHKFALDSHTTVLFDGGLVADSLIYRRAHQLAQEAEHILCVSQYCPTGRLARVLKKKEAQLYFNHWRSASLVNRVLIRISSFNAKNFTRYSRSSYLHSKFILFTLPGGHKIALTGSHNFMYGSGLVGTREIAIETTDKHIIKQIERFFAEYIG
jgi:cardiolipin synthase